MDDQLDIKNGISWVHRSLVLCGFTDQTFLVGERDERWGCKATLLVGNDFHISSLIIGNYFEISKLDIRPTASRIEIGASRNVPQEYVVPIHRKSASASKILDRICNLRVTIETYQDRYRSHLRRPHQPCWM